VLCKLRVFSSGAGDPACTYIADKVQIMADIIQLNLADQKMPELPLNSGLQNSAQIIILN
jgi:hypothetical protein